MSLTPSRHRRKLLAGPKGSGAPGIENAAVERRKADRLRTAGACLARARGGYICASRRSAPSLGSQDALPRFWGAQIGKTQQKLGRDCPAARRKKRVTLRTWLFDNWIWKERAAAKPRVRLSIFVMAGFNPTAGGSVAKPISQPLAPF